MAFNPAGIRQQQTFNALGQLGAGLLGYAAGDPRALMMGAAGAAQATDPTSIQRAQFEQERLQMARQQQQAQQQQAAAMQAALPSLSAETGIPAEVLALDPSAGIKALIQLRTPQKPPTGMRVGPGGNWVADPAYMEMQKMLRPMSAPKLDVVIEGQPQFGTIPPGYMMQRTGDSYQQIPVPGGPAEREISAQSAAQKRAAVATEIEGDLVNEKIANIKREGQESVFPAAGLVGSLASGVPGLGPANIANELDFLKDRMSLNALKEARASSATGASGMGQLSDKEGERLASQFGRLSQSVGTEKFWEDLEAFETNYNRQIHNRNPDGSTWRKPSSGGSRQQELRDKYRLAP